MNHLKLRFIFICTALVFTSNLFSQYTVVPDTAFEKALIELKIDDKMDGKILNDSCSTIDTLKLSEKQISSLDGIQAFVNLKSLFCSKNQLKHLDLSKNDSLLVLSCNNNLLTELDLSSNHKLLVLSCAGNQLIKLDLSKNQELLILRCEKNYLRTLDLAENDSLLMLTCQDNALKELNVSECKLLELLYCENNALSKLDISQNLSLVEFSCQDNPLQKLYISKLNVHDQFNDVGLYITGNEPLGYLMIKIIRK